MTASRRLDSIECLRGVSALLVVFYHYRVFLNDITPTLGHMLFENGRIGVDIFFVLSGFAIYLSTRFPSERRLFPFLVRRFFRIVPLAWLLIGLIYLLSPHATVTALVKSLLFVPLTHTEPPFFGYNLLTPAWTLMYELCFYVMFALALVLAPRHRGLVVTALVLCLILGLQWIGSDRLTLDAYDKAMFEPLTIGPVWVGVLASPLFFEFLCGVLLGYLHLHHADSLLRLPTALRIGLYAFLLAFFVAHFFSGFIMGHGLDRKGLAALSLFIFYLAMNIDPLLAWFQQYFAPGPGGLFRFLGKISFSLYVVHEVVHQAVHHIPIVYPLYDQTGGLGKFVTLLSFSVVLSYLLHIIVEVPCQKLGKRIATLWIT